MSPLDLAMADFLIVGMYALIAAVFGMFCGTLLEFYVNCRWLELEQRANTIAD